MPLTRFTDRNSQHLSDETDLRLLSVLHALLETSSVTKAAERLGIGQPAVSRSLAQLRIRFGDPLLIRVQGRMALSPRAQRMRGPLGAWLADGRTFLTPEEVDITRVERAFRIASTDYGVLSVVQPALRQIEKLARGVELLIQPLTTDSRRQLANGDLDLVITGFDPDLTQVHARQLFKEHHLCLADRNHPALRAGKMSFDDFFVCSHVAIRVQGGLAADYEGLYPEATRRRLVVTDNFMLAPALICGSQMVMTAPSRAAKRFSETYDLAFFAPPATLPGFNYWLAWHERSQRDPEVQWLIEQFSCAAKFDV